ncbi:SirB2 family protein [Ferrimonas pelagia]|uniref:SirB2 family protein n=1 Tax=Ferrimonas pelagia TaxID=1177826 RepID=A0ABP9EH47_9GAMM
MPYEALKHIHMTTIGLSVALLLLRFVWVMRGSAMMQQKWVKVLPHVVDTLLLLSGIVLMITTGWMPLRDAWLTEKLIALVAYIVLGAIALKAPKGKLFKSFAMLGALGWVYYMAVLAMTKQAMLLG